jgi:hypothetical protein
LSFSATPGAESGSASRTGKGCGTLFFGLFFAMGAIFTALLVAETVQQLAPWMWPEIGCSILSSGVEETGDDEEAYRASVHYRYEIGGRAYDGDRFFRSGGETASYDRARDRAGRYPAGAAATCRVHPDRPSLAVLERRLPWIGFVVFFPLIFVAIGAGGLYATWRSARAEADGQVESISQRASSGRGSKAMVLFGVLFVVVGCGVLIPLTVIPAIRFAVAIGWEAMPCTIVDSRLRSWSTDDGTSYRADVLYRYRAAGDDWTSNRIDFFSFVNSGRDRARAVLEKYPSGVTATCWVDPSDSSRSVLERRLGPMHGLGLLPLIFVVAGGAVASAGWKKLRSQPPRSGQRMEESESAGGPLQLEPEVGPAGKLMGALLFGVIWNGIVSVFVWQAYTSWEAGRPDWFLTLFMVPFVLVGLFTVGLVGYLMLALANPRPRLTITPGRPRLGDRIRLEWRFSGSAGRLRRLRIALEGREEATYQRGTDTHTDREVFATHVLVDTSDRLGIPRGTAELMVPDDTMHSFEANSNSIIWELKVAGDIARWPDVDQSFPIQIRPLRIEDL